MGRGGLAWRFYVCWLLRAWPSLVSLMPSKLHTLHRRTHPRFSPHTHASPRPARCTASTERPPWPMMAATRHVGPSRRVAGRGIALGARGRQLTADAWSGDAQIKKFVRMLGCSDAGSVRSAAETLLELSKDRGIVASLLSSKVPLHTVRALRALAHEKEGVLAALLKLFRFERRRLVRLLSALRLTARPGWLGTCCGWTAR